MKQNAFQIKLCYNSENTKKGKLYSNLIRKKGTMKQEKVTFIHSISAKITLLAVFIVVVSLVGR